MKHFTFFLLTFLTFFSACTLPEPETLSGSLPNIVVIYCDDLGYGDLGCFGNEVIRTPHIDRMAEEGMKFTEFYSASPVCSPSRAALLTGRIPQRMGINSVFFPRSFTGMPLEEITTADLLKSKGYATGIVGKWHLGHREKFLPLQRGFDEYFGIPYSNDMHSAVYMEGNEVAEYRPDQHFTTRTYTEKACDFIERHAEAPFYLYLAHSMPHVPIYASPEFDGRSGHGLYTDVIEEIDWSVGEVLKKLEEQGVLRNTLVVFSSDNGPWLAMREHGGSAGNLREGKQYTFEGGQRVPTLAMWPEVIEAGSVYEDMALMMDWFPTFAGIAATDLPSDRDYDGESLLKVLDGSGKRVGREFLYYDGAELQGYRNGDWKLKLPYEGFSGGNWKKAVAPHDTLLFNLKSDPGEKRNLYHEQPEKVKELVALMNAYRDSKGTYAPSLDIGATSDQSHNTYLVEKYGPDFNRVDW
ncbi:MAG: sulfatase [Bacteroidales bacterium]|nr:sulfatase [Bacteroidales bacterium]